MAKTPEGDTVYLPGINWSRVKRETRVSKQGRVAVAEDKVSKLNKAMHHLIALKKRYMAANESPKRIKAVQVEIDKLLKQKRSVVNAERYIDWMKEKGVK